MPIPPTINSSHVEVQYCRSPPFDNCTVGISQKLRSVIDPIWTFINTAKLNPDLSGRVKVVWESNRLQEASPMISINREGRVSLGKGSDAHGELGLASSKVPHAACVPRAL